VVLYSGTPPEKAVLNNLATTGVFASGADASIGHTAKNLTEALVTFHQRYEQDYEETTSLKKEVGYLREFKGLAEKLQKEKEAWEKEKQRLQNNVHEAKNTKLNEATGFATEVLKQTQNLNNKNFELSSTIDMLTKERDSAEIEKMQLEEKIRTTSAQRVQAAEARATEAEKRAQTAKAAVMETGYKTEQIASRTRLGYGELRNMLVHHFGITTHQDGHLKWEIIKHISHVFQVPGLEEYRFD